MRQLKNGYELNMILTQSIVARYRFLLQKNDYLLNLILTSIKYKEFAWCPKKPYQLLTDETSNSIDTQLELQPIQTW